MSDYPLTQTLLAQLLALDGVDARLPPEILVSLHRSQLAKPFEGLLAVMASLPPLAVIPQQLAEKMVDALQEELHERYPLVNGLIFVEYKDLERLERAAFELRKTRTEWQALIKRHGFIRELLQQHEDAYKGYYPVITLLQLSWRLSSPMRANRLRALELQLEVEPQVQLMLLALARLGRPVQSEQGCSSAGHQPGELVGSPYG
jgi:hypothetical protein